MRLLQAAQCEVFFAGCGLGWRFAARSWLGQCRIPWGLSYIPAYKANCARGKPPHTNLIDRFAGWHRRRRNVTR
jgi:hypothetical protein